MVTFDARTAGTPSARWESDVRFALAAEVDLATVRNLVVVAAHPDDETLGAGGLIAFAAESKIPVRVIVVTDGSGSHPNSPTVTKSELASRRRRELDDALGRLATDAQVSWLGFPDGQVADFTIEVGDRLRDELAGFAAGSHVVTVWSKDGHTDHEHVGRIVEAVAPLDATVWGYPIWMWHWAHPDEEHVPWDSARILPLSERIRAQKTAAISLCVSQVQPLSSAVGDERVLEPAVLEHFARQRELFFELRGAR